MPRAASCRYSHAIPRNKGNCRSTRATAITRRGPPTSTPAAHSRGKLLANISAYWSDQFQGWGRNVTTGTPTFRSRDYGTRIQLLWNYTERTNALLTLDYDKTVAQRGLGFMAFPGTGSL